MLDKLYFRHSEQLSGLHRGSYPHWPAIYFMRLCGDLSFSSDMPTAAALNSRRWRFPIFALPRRHSRGNFGIATIKHNPSLFTFIALLERQSFLLKYALNI